MISKEEAKINKAIEYLEEIEDVLANSLSVFTRYSVRELARKAINILEDKGLIKDEF